MPSRPAAETRPACAQERLRLLERLEQRPLKVRREEQEQLLRGLTPAEQDSLLDLRPFMQRNPCMVHSDASLSRAYRLFRTMGLRHLFVCQPQPRVRSLPAIARLPLCQHPRLCSGAWQARLTPWRARFPLADRQCMRAACLWPAAWQPAACRPRSCSAPVQPCRWSA